MNVVENNNLYKKLLKPEKNVKYSFRTKAGDKALIIAPHPDDEVLGCAGIIQKMLNLSMMVEVVLLTDGAGENHNQELAQIRREEFYKAISSLGNIAVTYLGFPDGSISENYEKVIDSLSLVFQNSIPDIVFLPYVFDYNLDHQVCNFVLERVLTNLNLFSLKEIAMYEVWTPILYPNCYINVTDEFDVKKNAISIYRSQEKRYHIFDKVLALNTYRAKFSMRTNVRYMECFRSFNVKEYIDIISFLKCVFC